MPISKLKNVVLIIADGAIANPRFADGRMIPVLIVNCDAHQTLIDLTLVHRDTAPGDVGTRWGWNLLDRRKVYLEVTFIRPVPTIINIEFDVRKQGVLVYGIMAAHGFYIQPSHFAPTVSEGFGKPSVIVEVPPHVVPPKWEATCESQLIKRFKKEGFSGKQAREVALGHIARAKEMWNIRTRLPDSAEKQ